MGIEEVADIIGNIATGIEDACAQCLEDNSETVLKSIKEQLYAGVDGDGSHLEPTYLNDPYLVNRKKPWLHAKDDKTYIGPQGYLDWKKDITPPRQGEMLGLPRRPEAVPNLIIDGTFYNSIKARKKGTSLEIESGTDTGKDIVEKYGDQILGMCENAIGYFNANVMLPALASFFEKCGYR